MTAIKELGSVVEGIQKLEAELDRLKGELKDSRVRERQVVDNCEAYRQELADLKKKPKNHMQKLQQVQQLASQRLAEIETLKDQIEILNVRLEKALAEVRDMNKKVQEQDRVLLRVLKDKEHVVKLYTRKQ